MISRAVVLNLSTFPQERSKLMDKSVTKKTFKDKHYVPFTSEKVITAYPLSL